MLDTVDGGQKNNTASREKRHEAKLEIEIRDIKVGRVCAILTYIDVTWET